VNNLAWTEFELETPTFEIGNSNIEIYSSENQLFIKIVAITKKA
jgi:hypothetical protein